MRSELGLDCSVGGGRSKLIAKLASKAAKPRISADGPLAGAGVLIVTADEEVAFLHGHPVRALPGVGPRTAEKLARLGISGIDELAALPADRLVALFGKRQGAALLALAHGQDERPVEPNRALRSIGHEETFARDLRSLAELEEHARRQAGMVAERCRRSDLFGRTVQVKLRYADFSTLTRSRTLDHRVTSAVEIAELAVALLGALERTLGVRLLGVSVSNLESGEEARQLALFGSDGVGSGELPRREKLDSLAHSVRDRFGAGAISAASALETARRPGGGG